VPDPSTPGTPRRRSLAVFDIDGVLADVRHRLHHVAGRPKDWAAFFGAAPDDQPLAEGVAAARTAVEAGHVVVYLTGRPERCREDTQAWLAEHGLPAGELHMRPEGDRRPARLTKVATLRQLARRDRIAAFVDDDPAVVEAARAAGLPVLHADWMSGGPDRARDPWVQEVLFDVQQRQGRT